MDLKRVDIALNIAKVGYLEGEKKVAGHQTEAPPWGGGVKWGNTFGF